MTEVMGTWPWLALSGPPAVVALALFAVNVPAALRRPSIAPFRQGIPRAV